jgi:ribonuclease P protein component
VPRLGVLVSRKHAARAIERNRIKRCIREAFRLEQEHLRGVDILVRPPYGVRPTTQMIATVRELLGKLGA